MGRKKLKVKKYYYDFELDTQVRVFESVRPEQGLTCRSTGKYYYLDGERETNFMVKLIDQKRKLKRNSKLH
jgi:hypothetical protein